MSKRFVKTDPQKHSQGRPILTGNPSRKNVVSLAPPPLTEGQARCPVCRNGVRVNPTGSLRKHRDLFNDDCWNRRALAFRLDEAPPVVMPSQSHYDAKKGECRECGKWLPGERSLCGRCSVLQGRAS